LLAWEEGLEVNLLTFNLGINPFKLHAKFPFIGSVGATPSVENLESAG
jgi:hypothetical protein